MFHILACNFIAISSLDKCNMAGLSIWFPDLHRIYAIIILM